MATLGSAYFVFKSKDNVSPVAKGIVKQLQGLGKTGKAVFGTLAAAGAAAGAAISAAAGVALKLAKDAVSAAIADNKEQEKLISILKARGVSAEVATKRTNQLIEAGQKLAFTDSETRAGYAIATQFTKKYAAQQKILTVAQDFARAKNISLAKATAIVGKAFAGNGKALKTYGIELGKGVKGNEAIEKIQRRVAGVAEAYSKTFAGQFDIIKDSVDETLESIGYAIGGGEGLPTFTRLLEGIRPVVEDLLGSIKDSLPDIQSFSRNLVEKFLAKLPTYVATAKRELPILIDKAKEFIGSVAGFAKDIGSFMGPEGLITTGLGIIGTKFGGLAGGIGAIFAEQFIKMGIDPITASITATLAGAITAGIVQGFASQVAIAAVNTFLGLFRRVPVSPSVSLPTVGGALPAAGAIGGAATTGILGVSVAAIAGVAAGALGVAGVVLAAKGLYDAIYSPAEQEKNATNNYKKLQDRIAREGVGAVTSSASGVYGSRMDTGESTYTATMRGVMEGIKSQPQTPIDLTNRLELKLDGRVVAESVNRYLGLTYVASGPTRTGGR
jgi:hypothetical protein